MDLLRIFFKRRVQVEIIFPAEGVQDGPRKTAFIRAGLPAQHRDGPFIDRQGRIRDHQFLGELHLVTQSEAFRAGAKRIVERKASRLDLLDADPAVRAGEALAEIHRLAVDHIHHQQPLRQMQHALHGIREPLLDPRPHDQTVYDDLDVVLNIFIQADLFRQFVHIAVNAHPHVPAFLRPLEKLRVGALAPAHHRRQQLDPGPFRQRHDLVHHLVHGLLHDLPTALRAVRDADPRVEQTEIVVDLRHRAHRRSGVVVRGLLVNGYGRGQPLNALHIRLLHLAQELTRIGRQRLHIAPLSFRVDRVKSKG